MQRYGQWDAAWTALPVRAVVVSGLVDDDDGLARRDLGEEKVTLVVGHDGVDDRFADEMHDGSGYGASTAVDDLTDDHRAVWREGRSLRAGDDGASGRDTAGRGRR